MSEDLATHLLRCMVEYNLTVEMESFAQTVSYR